jgi:hypothetical protein
MKTKCYIIEGRQHYRLHGVSRVIGVSYHEVYHNYEKWKEHLLLIRVKNHIYIDKDRADYFAKKTPGYVPIEYRYKRNPYVNPSPEWSSPHPRIKTIHGTVWVYKFSHSEKTA